MKKLLASILALTLCFPVNLMAGMADTDRADVDRYRNSLQNPGFESGKSKHVASSASTLTVTTSTPIEGKASGVFTPTVAAQTVSQVYAVPEILKGKNCAISFEIRTAVTDAKLQVWNGTNVLNEVVIAANTTARTHAINFVCPTTGNIGYRILAGASLGAITYDAGFIGDARGANLVNLERWPQYDISVTGPNWTTTTAKGIPYQTSNGVWRLRFNVRGTLSSTAVYFYGNFTGVTFASAAPQSISANLQEMGVVDRQLVYAYVANSDLFRVSAAAGNPFNRIESSGDVELASKPTWATATSSQLAVTPDQQIDYTGSVTAWASACPSGTIPATNKTIGLSSGNYQGATYYRLYSYLWDVASNTAGSPYLLSSAKGASAAADWSAGKTIAVDYSTNELFMRQDGSTTTLGAKQDDAFQGHAHRTTKRNYLAPGADYGTFANGDNTGGPLTFDLSNIVTDGVNGTPRTASETRPKNVAVNYCINYSGVAPAPVVLTGSPVYGRVSRVAGYNVTNTATAISFDTEALDNKNAHSSGTLTIPMSGVYNFNASATVISNTWAATNGLTLRITKNGVEQSKNIEQIVATGYVGMTIAIHAKIQCNVGDTIQVTIHGTSTNTMNGSGFSPDSFDWEWIAN